jgi:hypothetical protein
MTPDRRNCLVLRDFRYPPQDGDSPGPFKLIFKKPRTSSARLEADNPRFVHIKADILVAVDREVDTAHLGMFVGGLGSERAGGVIARLVEESGNGNMERRYESTCE